MICEAMFKTFPFFYLSRHSNFLAQKYYNWTIPILSIPSQTNRYTNKEIYFKSNILLINL